MLSRSTMRKGATSLEVMKEPLEFQCSSLFMQERGEKM